jgi:hypothetical protein
MVYWWNCVHAFTEAISDDVGATLRIEGGVGVVLVIFVQRARVPGQMISIIQTGALAIHPLKVII